MLPVYASDLVKLGVSHVTITINAIDPKIGAQIYKYVDYMGTRYTGEAGASILMANQLAGLKYLTENGIICKINMVMLKGVNDHHIVEVVKKVKELGAEITNIMQLIPVEGSVFENMPLVSNKELMNLRKECGVHMKQMYHCKQCRADAIGTLDKDQSIQFRGCGSDAKAEQKKPVSKVAVATKSGVIVDQHFGHAEEFYIYESDGKEVKFIETRNVDKYCSGIEECGEKENKIENILTTVSDCQIVMALRIGTSPSTKLAQKGIKVITTYDLIENAVKTAARSV
jgi:MoaA/NifB/PqqE/SkfB family radical SAM enzyme